ncbi:MULTISPECIES: hypothetical protein [unclassified Streptomyces]|uniref:hypothetical protein n=1 Tax=unclassified Streptomyces TaxID=2593676 RepID=UPI00278C8653|nr:MULTISPECIES: hypothetical protein [unclassified Streptomyces]
MSPGNLLSGPAHSDIEQRAVAALPPGTRVHAATVVRPGPRLRRPARRHRPRVLVGQRLPGDRWAGFKRGVWGGFRLYDIFAPDLDPFWWLHRNRTRRAGKPLTGGRGSLAGRFASALYPRVPTTDAATVLLLTDRDAMLVYVQRSRRGDQLGATEPGLTVPAHDLLSVTHQPQAGSDACDLTFTDQSVVRVNCPWRSGPRLWESSR